MKKSMEMIAAMACILYPHMLFASVDSKAQAAVEVAIKIADEAESQLPEDQH
jgi:hypothetical protein